MIAAIEQPDALHIVLWIGRVGLKAKGITYCGKHLDAGAGTVQAPDSVLEGKSWQSVSDPRVQLKICSACTTRIR